jgi:hypothetical protein
LVQTQTVAVAQLPVLIYLASKGIGFLLKIRQGLAEWDLLISNVLAQCFQPLCSGLQASLL